MITKFLLFISHPVCGILLQQPKVNQEFYNQLNCISKWRKPGRGLVTKSRSDSWDPIDCHLPGDKDFLSIGFSRQEYWSGLPFPSPEDLPDWRIEHRSPVLQADSLLTELWGKHIQWFKKKKKTLGIRTVITKYLEEIGSRSLHGYQNLQILESHKMMEYNEWTCQVVQW